MGSCGMVGVRSHYFSSYGVVRGARLVPESLLCWVVPLLAALY